MRHALGRGDCLVVVRGGVRAETVRFASVAVGPVAAGPEIAGWLDKPAGPGALSGHHPCS
jgi:hypothetical protein